MKFEGIITPIVTPYYRDEQQSINYDATKLLINDLIDKGVHGIFILGSNGEFHVMQFEEKIAFAKYVVEVVNKRVPVYAGTGCCSTKEVISLSKEMEKVGVDALSIVNPYFLNLRDDELVQHYKMIAQNVNIPIMLYNIPKGTGKNINKEVVKELVKIPNILGIKDSSGDIENLKGYLEVTKGTNMEVLVGSDSKIAVAMRLGASGAVAGTSNLITSIIVELYDALKQGNDELANILQEKIEAIRTVLPLGSVPSILKRAMELHDMPVGPARLPIQETSDETDKKIKAALAYYFK